MHHNIIREGRFFGDMGGVKCLPVKKHKNLRSSRETVVYISDMRKISVRMPSFLNATSPIDEETTILEKV